VINKTFRPRHSWLFGAVLVGAGIGLLVALALEQNFFNLLRFGSGAILLGYLGWLMYWAPNLELVDELVILRNPFRTIRLNLGAVTRIDTKFALSLYVQGTRFVAWAAPAPGRHIVARTARSELNHLPKASFGIAGTLGLGDLPNSDSGDASYLIRNNWQQVQGGLVNDADAAATVEFSIQLHSLRIVILLLLAAAFAAGVSL
jgi:hypothetical protein